MDYWGFLVFCVVATFSPGPAVLLAIKNSACYGILPAMQGIGGNVAAVMTLASFSAAGLGVIILASGLLFSMVKILGGLYLIYLGVKAFNSRGQFNATKVREDAKSGGSRKQRFIEGYIVGISNPKAIAFYTAVFPQFIDLHQAVLPQFTLLAATFAGCSFFGLSFYALATTQMSHYLAKDLLSRGLHRVTGGLFIGFGVSLMLSNRN